MAITQSNVDTKSNEELIHALADIIATLDVADAHDREFGSDEGGKYRDEAAAIRWELSKRRLDTADVDRELRMVKMTGLTSEHLAAEYGIDSTNSKLCGGPLLLAGSILSDVQELLSRGDTKSANTLINRAKHVLFTEARRVSS